MPFQRRPLIWGVLGTLSGLVLLTILVQWGGGEEPDPALAAIIRGEVPPHLIRQKDPEILEAVTRRLRRGEPWRSGQDRRNAVMYFITEAPLEDADLLFSLVQTEPIDLATYGVARLATIADEKMLDRVAARFANASPYLMPRLFDVIARSKHPHAGEIAARETVRALAGTDRQVLLSALRTATEHRLASAVEPAVALLARAKDEQIVQAVCRSLGMICEAPSGSVPEEDEDKEKNRLRARHVLLEQSLGKAATVDACSAFFRVSTGEELETFLTARAIEPFENRLLFVQAAEDPDLDPAKAGRVHDAFLDSPDSDLVIRLLLESPHLLAEERVALLLKDERQSVLSTLPEGTRVCEAAAFRIRRDREGAGGEFPEEASVRQELVERIRAALSEPKSPPPQE